MGWIRSGNRMAETNSDSLRCIELDGSSLEIKDLGTSSIFLYEPAQQLLIEMLAESLGYVLTKEAQKGMGEWSKELPTEPGVYVVRMDGDNMLLHFIDVCWRAEALIAVHRRFGGTIPVSELSTKDEYLKVPE